MGSSNLLLHCGAFSAARAELETIVTPPATTTWSPIPHTEIVC